MPNAYENEVGTIQRDIEEAVQHYRKIIEENGDASSVPHNLIRLEGQEVTDFSSQYGSENSYSYVASNLAGKTSVFPSYGDFINACVFRTYGPWWSMAPSGIKRYRGTPSSFISVDFIEVIFSQCLYPVSIEVYETYNSGSIVRILACDKNGGTSADNGKVKWVTLWEGPQQSYTKPRIFSPPLKRVDFATNLIRLELNHDSQEYYTELDGIRLVGSKSLSEARHNADKLDNANSSNSAGWLDFGKLIPAFEKLSTSKDEHATADSTECCFTFLPEEIIQLLLSYLDTRDLCRLSQTCRHLRDQCYDPLLYTDLNLKPFWTQVVSSTFTSLSSRCQSLKRLNISWCGKGGSIDPKHLTNFLESCKSSLKTLEMSSCQFISAKSFSDIVFICSKLTELNLHSCTLISDFSAFRKVPMPHLKKLNLYRTKIDDDALTALFRTSPDLEHLNIGSCPKLSGSINVVLMELGLKCRKLKSIDLWRMKNLEYEGFTQLYTNCVMLEEIDLGWCTSLKSSSNCFVRLASTCKNMKKLFLTANRTVSDKDIRAVTDGCPLLEQLDILGTREVTKPTILRLLEQCKNMTMLDVSFCVGISFTDVLGWRSMFPQVSIKKSFQNISEL